MIDKVALIMTCMGMVVVGLLMMPYLLYMGWVRIIALKKQGRGLDLHSSASNYEG